MSGSKRPVWLFVAVMLGLAVVAFVALRRQPSAVSAQASIRPTPATSAAQAPPPTSKPAASAIPLQQPQGAAPTSSGSTSERGAGALANVPAVFGPQLLTSTSGPQDWAMEGNNPSRTRSTGMQLTLPLSQQRE